MESKKTITKSLTGETLDGFLNESEFAVVDFSAEWCPPCRALDEALSELAPQYQNTIAFGQVDIDAQEDLADRFDVESVPHLVFFKSGKAIETRQGFLGVEKLQNDLERLIEGDPKDLTPLFADGDLWELDDELVKDILPDISRAVLFFTDGKSKRGTTIRKMISLAKKYRKMVFFGILDSRRCPESRYSFRVLRGSATMIFLYHQRVVSRLIKDVSEREYREYIEQVLEVSL
jgi:thioredoxin 1